jgi:signal transduction histidine kinase
MQRNPENEPTNTNPENGSMQASPDGTLEVLIVEDNPGDVRLIEHHLRADEAGLFDPPALTQVDNLNDAFDALESDPYDLVLLDLGLPESKGIDTLLSMTEFLTEHEGVRPVPVVVLTGLKDRETALEAIQAGAQDYLVKGNIDGESLERAIRYALERHEQEQELKRQNQRLERFASVVSHDLRNPLNAARSMAETVVAETEEGDEFYRETRHIQRAHDRMEEIIADVLTLARQGQSVDETEPVSLADVADGCWETVGTADGTLTVETGRTVEADRSRLRQLLENLFRNSIEHVGGDATVTVGELEDGFYVADDGPGIPEDVGEDIFEMGYTTNQEGTGFGLNIVKEVAEAHGWTVTSTDSESGGARFEITGVELG